MSENSPLGAARRILEKLPRPAQEKPFRYLGRRTLQAMVDAATSNLVLGRRSTAGRYVVVRLVEDDREREEWEREFAESREALVREIQREAAARSLQLRGAPGLDLVLLTRSELEGDTGRDALQAVVPGGEVDGIRDRLREGLEVILPRRLRTLVVESEPSEAQVYLDDRPVGVTPFQIEEVSEGEHRLLFARRGFLSREERIQVGPEPGPARLTCRARLTPEPEMGRLEVMTFPPGAQVWIGDEVRESPCSWRLPAGPVEVRAVLDEYREAVEVVDLRPEDEERPRRLLLRLDYAGPDRDEVVGRLIVYKPGTFRAPGSEDDVARRLRSFFGDDPDATDLDGWDLSAVAPPEPVEPVVLGEMPLTRGVVLIGRDDPSAELQPDVRLRDAENSVSRGCHAWLWIYADRSTGADFNTFLIGNCGGSGVRVDGEPVTGTRRLPDDGFLEVGRFGMRIVKEVPEPSVELRFR